MMPEPHFVWPWGPSTSRRSSISGAWFDAERASRIGFSNCITICDYVLNGKSYGAQDKVDFTALKATTLYHHGREKELDDAVGAAKLLASALKLHAQVYKANILANSPKSAVSERYLHDTAFVLFQLCSKNFHFDESVRVLLDVLTINSGYLDPTEDAIANVFGRIQPRGHEVPVLHRAKRELAKLSEVKVDAWMDRTCWTRVYGVLSALDSGISAALKKRG